MMKSKADLHLSRKLWHVLTGVIALSITYLLSFDSKMAAIASGSIAGVGIIAELIRLKNPKINDLILKRFGTLFRESEKSRPSGLVFYALGVSICFSLYEWHIAIISILFLVFSDPFASLIGNLYGSRKLIKGKSLEGFLACFALSLLITFLYTSFYNLGYTWWVLIVIGLIGAISELFSFIDDNLSIPVLSGALITFVIAV